MAGSDRTGTAMKVRLVGLAVVGVFTALTFGWVIPGSESLAVRMRRESLREQVQVACTVLGQMAAATGEEGGEAAVDRAKAMGLAILKQIRYGAGQDGYIWINDMRGVMLMHPTRPELVGKNLMEMKDPTGKAFLAEFVEVCRTSGEGYVDYVWQHDTLKQFLPKTSYVCLFEPWGWVVGSGFHPYDVGVWAGPWLAMAAKVCGLLSLAGLFGVMLMARGVAAACEDGARHGAISAEDELGGGLRLGATFQMRTCVRLTMLPALAAFTLAWCVVFYGDIRRSVLAGFDGKLSSVGCATAAFIGGEEHGELAAAAAPAGHEGGVKGQAAPAGETNATYRKYVEPMRVVARATDLTYLYTQTLDEATRRLRYVLDASEGENHTPLGFEEDLSEADYRIAHNVMLNGIVYVSDVETTENWGILKYVYAPIMDSAGSIVGIAGADINIGAIRTKTRAGLMTVCLAGLAALAIAGAASLRISGRITGPVASLKEGALRVARGDYGIRLEVSEPDEVGQLAEVANGIGARLTATLADLRNANAAMESRKRGYDLLLALDKENAAAEPENRSSLSSFLMLNAGVARKTGSGWVRGPGISVCWMARPIREPMDAVRFRSDVTLVVAGLGRRAGWDAARMSELLAGMFGRRITIFFVFSEQEGLVHCVPKDPTVVVKLRGGHFAETLFVDKAKTVALGGGEGLLVSEEEAVLEEMFINAVADMRPPGTDSVVDWVSVMREQSGLLPEDQQAVLGVMQGHDSGDKAAPVPHGGDA